MEPSKICLEYWEHGGKISFWFHHRPVGDGRSCEFFEKSFSSWRNLTNEISNDLSLFVKSLWMKFRSILFKRILNGKIKFVWKIKGLFQVFKRIKFYLRKFHFKELFGMRIIRLWYFSSPEEEKINLEKYKCFLYR